MPGSTPAVQERMVLAMRGERRDEECAGRAGGREWRAIERLLVLALLRRDHVERWSRAGLEQELTGIRPQAIEAALRGLSSKGVACVAEGQAWASPATRALDDLGMICI
jgi:hypothetical protein